MLSSGGDGSGGGGGEGGEAEDEVDVDMIRTSVHLSGTENYDFMLISLPWSCCFISGVNTDPLGSKYLPNE